MKILGFKIESNGPLLQHDDKTANPFDEYTKQLKAISSKRKKTDEDLLKMAEIEWNAGLYYTRDDGYFMKAECFEGSFLEAAKAKKMGKIFKEAVRVPDNPVFHFPQEKLKPDKLFRLPEYKDFRTIKIQRSKILRCRPIFNQWYCDVEVWYEETRLDRQDLIDVVNYAGRYIGICDYRPKYGRYKVSEVKDIEYDTQ